MYTVLSTMFIILPYDLPNNNCQLNLLPYNSSKTGHNVDKRK